MLKIEIVDYQEEELENAGCNNGNYPFWDGLDTETGVPIRGVTCRCHAGCNDTDCIESENGKMYLVIEDD